MEFIRGDSVIITFPANDIKLDDIDELALTARQFPREDSPILFSKTKKDFVLIDGNYEVEILPEDTEQLYVDEFSFDIEITLKDGTRGSKIANVKLTKDYTIHGGNYED